MGRYGCDPNDLLVTVLVSQVAAFEPDIVLMAGDFIGHGIPIKGKLEPKDEETHFNELRDTMTDLFTNYITAYLSNSVVLPVFGNNDGKYHYGYATNEVQKQELYDPFFDLWFEHHPGNVENFDIDTVRHTFHEGGYYHVSTKGVEVFGLNSLHFSVKNAKLDQSLAITQMTWFANELDKLQNEKKNVIILFHVPPGQYFPGEPQTFWQEQYTQQYRDIIKRNREKILLTTGAHIHFMDMRYEDDEEGNPFYYILLAPSFSPEFGNNPGYTTLNIDGTEIHDVFFNFLDL